MAYIFVNQDLQQIWEAIQNLNGQQNPIIAEVNITGLSVIDMSGFEYADIVNLVSANATETVTRIINTASNKTIIFRPEPGLNIDFNNKSALVPNSNLRLFAATQTPNGSKQGFIALQKRTVGVDTDFYETSFIDEYTA